MFWELVTNIVLFWFSSVSFIFIAMIILFGMSYLYDILVWSRRRPQSVLRVPCPTFDEPSTPDASESAARRKGAKWKKSSKKAAEKREKEINMTDYETSTESFCSLSTSLINCSMHTINKKIPSSAAPLPTAQQNNNIPMNSEKMEVDAMSLECGYKIFSREESIPYLNKNKEEDRDSTLSSLCIPMTSPTRKSGVCMENTNSPMGSDTTEYRTNLAPQQVTMFSPSPHIALTGPGPGSFVANRAEPIITPSAYVDPPIYGNIMPFFNLETAQSQTNEQKKVREGTENQGQDQVDHSSSG